MTARLEIPFIKVNQWLKDWNTVQFDEENRHEYRRKSVQHFYVFAVKAGKLTHHFK
ncbi:MAG: hypothetical protein Kow0098_24320 [Ignavibacteriaceae bacterium]